MALFLKDVMNRDVASINPDRSIRFASRILKTVDISCLVAIEKSGIVGILTERDIVQKVISPGLDPDKTKVRDVMSKNVITIDKDKPIESAADVMEKNGIKKIPITESGKLIGIITMTDIVKAMKKGYFDGMDGHDGKAFGQKPANGHGL